MKRILSTVAYVWQQDKAAKSFTFPETNYVYILKKKKKAAECYSCSYKGCQLGKIIV